MKIEAEETEEHLAQAICAATVVVLPSPLPPRQSLSMRVGDPDTPSYQEG